MVTVLVTATAATVPPLRPLPGRLGCGRRRPEGRPARGPSRLECRVPGHPSASGADCRGHRDGTPGPSLTTAVTCSQVMMIGLRLLGPGSDGKGGPVTRRKHDSEPGGPPMLRLVLSHGVTVERRRLPSGPARRPPRRSRRPLSARRSRRGRSVPGGRRRHLTIYLQVSEPQASSSSIGKSRCDGGRLPGPRRAPAAS